jgi:hypothetical protein
VYGALQLLHVVFGLFFALLIVCAIRGLSLHVSSVAAKLRLRDVCPFYSLNLSSGCQGKKNCK